MRKLTVVSSVLVFAALAAAGWALQPASQSVTSAYEPGVTDQPIIGLDRPVRAFTPQILKAKELLGLRVENPAGERLGKIEDIVLTPDESRIAYCVLTFGGAAGIGDKLFAVPFPAFKNKSAASALILNKTQSEFKAAPGFDSRNWPNLASADLTRSLNEFYGQHPELTGIGLLGGAAAAPTVENRRVSKMLGMNVDNARHEKIGEISDIAFDTHKGDAVYGIISLAPPAARTGADLAAVPWKSLAIRRDTQTAMLAAERSALEAIAFKKDEFPDLASRDYARRTYEHFNREPYWGVYGYAAPGIEPRRAAEPENGPPMQENRAYDQMFDPMNVSIINGTVVSLGVFEPAEAAKPRLELRLRADTGLIHTVQLAPRAFMLKNDLLPARGDRLTITGCPANLNGRSVFIASEIQKGSQTLVLRDSRGMPTWHTTKSTKSMGTKVKEVLHKVVQPKEW